MLRSAGFPMRFTTGGNHVLCAGPARWRSCASEDELAAAFAHAYTAHGVPAHSAQTFTHCPADAPVSRSCCRFVERHLI